MIYKAKLPLTFKRAIQIATSSGEQLNNAPNVYRQKRNLPTLKGKPFHKFASTIFIPSK